MNYNIAVIPGDGIGPEVIDESIKVLNKIGEKYNHTFEFEFLQAGGCAIDSMGTPLPEKTLERCKESDAVLLGAVGGIKWDNPNAKIRPEQALLGLRGGLNLYCNLRPALLYKPLKEASPLKDSIIGDGIDICVVRELTGGIYFGERGREVVDRVISAYDTERYNINEIKRIVKIGFETAMKRNKKLTSVDKANILESSRLWRGVVEEMSKEYPEVEVNHLYIDNASMQLVRDPKQFDVIVTSNMFGDILSDEGAGLVGGLGMIPSANIGDNSGLFEPVHGSAPDIAGQGIADPVATILSACMMLDYLGESEYARKIEDVMIDVIRQGDNVTPDLGGDASTQEMAEYIASKL